MINIIVGDIDYIDFDFYNLLELFLFQDPEIDEDEDEDGECE